MAVTTREPAAPAPIPAPPALKTQTPAARDARERRAAAETARVLEAELAARLAGEVRFDQTARMLYSTDASNYQIEPIGVVLPRTLDDAVATVELAASHGVPIL